MLETVKSPSMNEQCQAWAAWHHEQGAGKYRGQVMYELISLLYPCQRAILVPEMRVRVPHIPHRF